MKTNSLSRRRFIQRTLGVAATFPTIVPASVFGAGAPSNRLQLGCIGMGRMARGDTKDFLRFDQIQVVAVCDVDRHRNADGRALVESYYAERTAKSHFRGCREYADFQELVTNPAIDAVSIVSPDHWHALHALAAAREGKDIFLQKPLTYTIQEGRALSDTVHERNRILQVGSQQRSDRKFRLACELVRNGFIGQLTLVKVGFGLDPAGEAEPVMPVPDNLNYEAWLGPAPAAPYTEKRVHPQADYSRPGWLRIQDYCHGMITGWGSHHMDIAHWGMGTERTGPVKIVGWAEYPKRGLWNVHGKFRLEYTYASGVRVVCAGNDVNKQGVEFIGTEGWVHVKRGHIETDPSSLLTATIPVKGRLYPSSDHKGNFLECIQTRSEPVAPVEIGHRSNTACVLGAMAMRLGRPLTWDPTNETFPNDDEANGLCTRTMRPPWKI